MSIKNKMDYYIRMIVLLEDGWDKQLYDYHTMEEIKNIIKHRIGKLYLELETNE